ncbi:hypothetical protein HRbin33_00322 [bacterium HR33]|nr:hypothetical protein HRbin33_00322 [bacterium HR33]
MLARSIALVSLAAAAFAARISAQQERTIRGLLLDRRDSLPVAGARVEVLGLAVAVMSDPGGRFVLRGLPRRSLELRFSAAGFVPETLALSENRDSITVFLNRMPFELAPVEVRGEVSRARRRFEEIAQPSTVSLEADELRRTPSVLEPDVVRVVQLLPGTVARNDYSIGYNVRGGESDQNLVLLDGVPIFNPSHLGGLFSTFDPDAVQSTDFLTGGFPAVYSGRLSSVLDISLRSGRRDRIHGSGQISLLSSKLLLEGPLPRGASFLVGARRTYLDAVVDAFSDERLPYYFADAIGRVDLPIGSASRLAVSGYWGRDALDLRLVEPTESRDALDLAFNWGNRLLGAEWQTGLGDWRMQAQGAVSQFGSTLGLLPDLARFHNQVLLQAARLTAEPPASSAQRLTVGLSVERYRITYDLESPTLGTVFLNARFDPTVWAAFTDYQWTPTPRLFLRPGLRLEHVPDARFTGLAPRVAFKGFLSPSLAVTGSAGRYYQPLHSIRDQELPVTIYEFWVGADPWIPVGRADHLVLGVEAWRGSEFQLTVEGYGKWYYNLQTQNQANDPRVRGDEFITTTGNAWGLDVLLRRHLGKVRGWIAYSYTRAERNAGGIKYPPGHDRRHTLNLVLQAPGPLGSELGVRWGYGSPLPYTPFLGQWERLRYNPTDHAFEDPEEQPIAGPINSARFPHYSRLDVGFRWRFKRWGASWEPFFQIANLYNRRNVFLYFFDYGIAPPTRTGVSQLPFLPAFGLEVRF